MAHALPRIDLVTAIDRPTKHSACAESIWLAKASRRG